jgi:HAD superfamily hydrolase (TIGR01509 family)
MFSPDTVPPDLVSPSAERSVAVLFDFNGVLVDDEPLHFQAFDRVLSDAGLSMCPEHYRNYLGLDDRGTFAAFLADRGREILADELDRWVQRKQTLYAQLMQGRAHLFPGARDLVLFLHRAAVPMALVSGARRAEIDSVLMAAQLDGCLEVIVSAEDVQRCKPDPEGYRLAFAGLRSRWPGLTSGIAIEDAPGGIAAARAAGLRCIGITTTCTPAELAGADRVVHSLKEIDATAPLPGTATIPERARRPLPSRELVETP